MKKGHLASKRLAVEKRRRIGSVAALFVVLRSVALTAKSPAQVPARVQTVGLKLPKPELLLNHMADRYASTRRILMEFIDNSLDDAESFFDIASDSYARPVKVQIEVDPVKRSVTITDNCRGMDVNKLQRVTQNIGDSDKRGQSLVNGQFGFGMQAFRAFCSTLCVWSRTESEAPLWKARVSRSSDQYEFVQEDRMEFLDSIPESGTRVLLDNTSQVWSSGDDELSVDACAQEIETHFERLLSRDNLEVLVTGPAHDCRRVCQPEGYSDNETEMIINRSVPLGGGQTARIVLSLGSMEQAQSLSRPARFFVKGRRIGKAMEIKSFFKASENRWTVWNHPQVLGFIDVLGNDEGPLRPVITRDEFKLTDGRDAAYRVIMNESEMLLLSAIEKANQRSHNKSFALFERALTAALARVSQEDKAPRVSPDTSVPLDIWNCNGTLTNISVTNISMEDVATQVAGASSVKPKTKRNPGGSRKKNGPKKLNLLGPHKFSVRFVEDLGSGSENLKRSALVGNEILVNMLHTDFKERFKLRPSGLQSTHQNNRRLSCYLANLVSVHYNDATYRETDQDPQRAEAFSDCQDRWCRLEERINRALPLIFRQVAQPSESVEERAAMG